MLLGDKGGGNVVCSKERVAVAIEEIGIFKCKGSNTDDSPCFIETIGCSKKLLMQGDSMVDDLVCGVSAVCTSYGLMQVTMLLSSLSPCIH